MEEIRKISLKNVNTKNFTNLIKRSSSMDKMIFITVKGSEFESLAYNLQKTVIKRVESDFSKMCDSYENSCGEKDVHIQFSDANKLVLVLSLVGNEDVNITFDIDEYNYARKIMVENKEVSMNLPCADSAASKFLTLPNEAKDVLFNEKSSIRFTMDVNENEFKYMQQLLGLNKESVRIFFHRNMDDIFMSEIESTDDVVRDEINTILKNVETDENAFKTFENYEKMYCKKLNTEKFENIDGSDKYLACFNKLQFGWIDNDKLYNFEFHKTVAKISENGEKKVTPQRMCISSFDDEGFIKSTIIFCPVSFAA